MKKTFSIAVLALALVVGIPVMGFSSSWNTEVPGGGDFTFDTSIETYLDVGSYEVTITDQSDFLYYGLTAYTLTDEAEYDQYLGKNFFRRGSNDQQPGI